MIDYLTASDEELRTFCHSKSEKEIVGGLKYGNLVLKLSQHAVIKYGLGVTYDEAVNQEYAFNHLDPKIVRVPKVYRYFHHESPPWSIGYLVMEYIEGENLEKVSLEDHPQVLKDVTTAIKHVHSVTHATVSNVTENYTGEVTECQAGRSVLDKVIGSVTEQRPGPISGGVPHGYMWSEYGARQRFQTLDEIQDWINYRLGYFDLKVDLKPYELRFCHLDLARRNMILQPDGSICLLDWQSAGFYPRIFEIRCIHLLLTSDPVFFNHLLKELEVEESSDPVTLESLLKLYAIVQGYSL